MSFRLQPFELFHDKYISRLLNLGRKYLVTQTYYRAVNSDINQTQTPLLITDYDDLGQARIHKNAIKHDKYAAIIDLNKEAHLKKLREILSVNSKYRLYWSVVKDNAQLKRTIDKNYSENIRRYIDRNTNWRISRDATIRPVLDVTFGELFITLKHSGQQIRLKFEEIESS